MNTKYKQLTTAVRDAIEINPFNTLHAVGLYEGEKKINMALGDRVGHTLVLGTTRVGKTRLAEWLIARDIIIDPKGDLDLFLMVSE